MSAAQIFIVILAGVSLWLSLRAIRQDTPPVWRFAVPEPVPSQGTAKFETLFEYDFTKGRAHAPSIVTTDTGFELLWFEGSGEAQADVDIKFARFEPSKAGWAKINQGTRITRTNLGQAMEPEQLVITLGNTVENQNRSGHVFTTAVSVGGWAMASVADVKLGPNGPDWARKLNLSPILNRSHLVKSPMVGFADGSMGLTAYFELGATHGTLVRFADDGRVRDTARMTGLGKPIQPMILPLSESHAIAFLRDFNPSGRLLKCTTQDGGQSWSRVTPTDMRNPSAPVAALPLGDGRILIVANGLSEHSHALQLLLSKDDGESFQPIKDLEPEETKARYQVMRALPDGTILLAYSVNQKRGLRAFAFNLDWVDAQ